MLKKAKGYQVKPDEGVSNVYDNEQPDDLVTPCVWSLTGLRNSGKSYLMAQYLCHSQRRKVPLYDIVFIVTGSWDSNKTYWGEFIDEENAKRPTNRSIAEVLESIQQEKLDWDAYVVEMRAYKELLQKLKTDTPLTDEEAMHAYEKNLLDPSTWSNGAPVPPKWKRDIIRPAQCCLLFDDIIGSADGVMSSRAAVQIGTLNRHIAGLAEPFKGKYGTRTAIGCSIIYGSQVFKTNAGGVARPLRANNTHATIFKIRDPKSFEDIAVEVGSFVGKARFVEAYKKAVSEEYGCLTVTFRPQRDDLEFRLGLSQLIIIPKKELFEELEDVRVQSSSSSASSGANPVSSVG